MKRRIILVVFCIAILLAGCSNQKLSDKKEEFSDKGISYSFQLPKNWAFQEEYKDTYNQAAVFGAQDEKSKSDMFIRTIEKTETDLDKFKEKNKKNLLQAYELKNIYVETFDANNFPVVAYTFNGTFDKEKVFVHKFYVMAKKNVVEFTFYSAANGNYEKRAEIFEESVKTLREEKDETNTTETSVKDQNNKKIENTHYSFDFSGYKTITNSSGKRLLIIRYVFTNKSDVETAPNMWNTLVTLKQNDKELMISSGIEDDDTSDLGYLLQVAKKPIKKDEAIESAVVYEIQESSLADVSINFDQEAFEEQQPIVVPIINE